MCTYSRIAVPQERKEISSTYRKKNIKSVGGTRVTPKYVTDTIAIGPKNTPLDKFNARGLLAEVILLK